MKNLVLVNSELRAMFVGATTAGSVHDKRMADEASPYQLPAASRMLQDLGFVGFKLEGVTMEMPHKKPRGRELTAEQKAENQVLARRRVRIEHVNSSIKRCRIVKEQIRLRGEGIRDLVMEVCTALHNFRVRITPWVPMI